MEGAADRAIRMVGRPAVLGLKVGAVLGEAALNRFGRPGRDDEPGFQQPRFSRGPRYTGVMGETDLGPSVATARRSTQRLLDNLPTGD